MSGIALILWFNPKVRVLLTIEDMDAVMQIEFFILLASFLVTVAASGLSGKGGLVAKERPGSAILPIIGALVFGGGMTAGIGGGKLFLVYCVSLILHLLGTLRMTGKDFVHAYYINMLAMFTFMGLGFLALHIPLPTFGHTYSGFDPWNFKVRGHELAFWASAHFALLGYLHQHKERLFAHVLVQHGVAEPDE
jgi:hypothetical protein